MTLPRVLAVMTSVPGKPTLERAFAFRSRNRSSRRHASFAFALTLETLGSILPRFPLANANGATPRRPAPPSPLIHPRTASRSSPLEIVSPTLSSFITAPRALVTLSPPRPRTRARPRHKAAPPPTARDPTPAPTPDAASSTPSPRTSRSNSPSRTPRVPRARAPHPASCDRSAGRSVVSVHHLARILLRMGRSRVSDASDDDDDASPRRPRPRPRRRRRASESCEQCRSHRACASHRIASHRIASRARTRDTFSSHESSMCIPVCTRTHDRHDTTERPSERVRRRRRRRGRWRRMGAHASTPRGARPFVVGRDDDETEEEETGDERPSRHRPSRHRGGDEEDGGGVGGARACVRERRREEEEEEVARACAVRRVRVRVRVRDESR